MPRKQEQEDARSEVTQVAPGVLRMELPVAIPGLRHVNCYALLDDEGAALVDPGLPGPSTRQALRQRLGQAGLRESDVHTVVITHSHPDHFGCANWLARSGGARVLAYGTFGWGVGVAPIRVVGRNECCSSTTKCRLPNSDGSSSNGWGTVSRSRRAANRRSTSSVDIPMRLISSSPIKRCPDGPGWS